MRAIVVLPSVFLVALAALGSTVLTSAKVMVVPCPDIIRLSTGCPAPSSGANIDQGAVDVWATQHDGTNAGGGSGAAGRYTGNGSNSGNNNPSNNGASDQSSPSGPDPNMVLDPNCRAVNMQVCKDGYTVSGPESVDIGDLARFFADAPQDSMQPNGWALLGLDTNFYAHAPAQIADGTVLDLPASVRFTPVSFAWDYGDGISASGNFAGASWETLGLPELSATGTSHVYEASGTYTITLAVTYTAQYRFAAQGWANVAGSLTVRANDLIATVGAATTVLVDRDCSQAPAGPGCRP